MTSPAAERRGPTGTRRARDADRTEDVDWSWPAAWTGSTTWTGGVDRPMAPDRPAWPLRLPRPGRAAVDRSPGSAARLAALLLAGLFWSYAAHRASAPTLTADATTALCLWVVVQLARAAAGGTGAHDRLRAGGLAAAGAAMFTAVGGWLVPGLTFPRTSPGFLILVPLAAASAALWPGRAGRQPTSAPVQAAAAAAVAVGLARLGVLVALGDTASAQAHLALLAWLAPAALAAGPRCGWLLWQTSTRPARGARGGPARIPAPRTPDSGLPAPSLQVPGTRGTRLPGLPRAQVTQIARAVRAVPRPRISTRLASSRMMWPSMIAGVALFRLGHDADATSAGFALAALAVVAVGTAAEGRGLTALPCVAVLLVAAPVPWSLLGAAHADEATTCFRLLLLMVVIDLLTSDPLPDRTAADHLLPGRAALGPLLRGGAALVGLAVVAAVLPFAASAGDADGCALALLLGRAVAAAPAIRWHHRQDMTDDMS
ncbi:hypothetical protein UG55_103147 [Frankia sp. EI5c]|uniref:hypothetical protein n=1 Tax=Frankia sp. EI5c TaxID=683316 RepID=UPI0007C2DF1A|nr:hypothetical protein [Frankia sp. EI5c]OAA24200.1 hypothetical protein UG55_103147 [Frankia sp. EI5c]